MPINVSVAQTNYLISVSAPTSTIDVTLTGEEAVEVSITSAPILVDVSDGNTINLSVANVGAQGPAGPAGAAGQGVPVGGTAGQVLAKIDGTDYNTEWVPQSGGGGALAVSAGTSSGSLTRLVFSNSNSVSFGLNGSTITASASFAQSSLSFSNANGVSFGTAGSTLTASVAAQSSLSFSNGGGVTFGTAGSTLTASVQTNYLTSQSNQAFSASGGSSAFQTLNFANSNGFTFSNSNGSVIGSYTVPTQTAFVLSNSNNVSFGTAGSTVTASASFAQSSLSFSNLNGVTFGTAGSTLTASVRTDYASSNHSHGNPTLALTNLSGSTASASNGFTLSLSAAAGGGGADGYNILAAGTQTANTTGTVLFSNSNGLSFGMSNNSVITGSYTVPAQTEYVFSNSNGVTFGTNGSTVTASVNAGGGATQNISWFEPRPILNPQGLVVSSLMLQRFSIPAQISATLMDMILAISNSSSAGATISHSFGIYTINGSTAGLASSGSVSIGFNSTAAASSYTAVSATRYHSMPVTMNITPGEYLAGFIFNIATSGTSGTYSVVCNASALTVQQRPFGGGNRTQNFGYGVYATATTALPATFEISNVVQTSNVAIRPPWFALVGTY